jgi:hypothetical protein
MTLTDLTVVMVVILAIVSVCAWIFSPPAGPTEKLVRTSAHDFRVDEVFGGKFAYMGVTDMATGFYYKAPYCQWAKTGQVLHLKEEAFQDLPGDVTRGQAIRLQVGGVKQACDALTPVQYPAP